MQGTWKREQDGNMELYPQVDTYAADVEKYIIGNYVCKEKADNPIVQTVAANVNAVSLVKELETFSADFPLVIYDTDNTNLTNNSIMQNRRYKFAPSETAYKLMLALNGNAGVFATVFMFVMGGVIGGIIGYCVDMDWFSNFLWLVTAGVSTVIYCLFKMLLNSYVHGLKTYGFAYKDEKVFVINNMKSCVEEAIIKAIYIADKSFKEAVFTCEINGETEYIRGDDIYFSVGDAMCVMQSVMELNDTELKRYYPNWLNDKKFVKYYDSTLPQYGFSRNKQSTRTTLLCVASAKINGITYRCAHTAQELLQEYLTYAKKQKQLAKERQNLIEEIQAYCEESN